MNPRGGEDKHVLVGAGELDEGDFILRHGDLKGGAVWADCEHRARDERPLRIERWQRANDRPVVFEDSEGRSLPAPAGEFNNPVNGDTDTHVRDGKAVLPDVELDSECAS